MENTNDTLQENIQAYLNGELNENARLELLHQAQSDPHVAEELIFSKSLALALRHPELVAANTVLNAVIAEEGFPPPVPPASLSGRKWWTWASVIVIALLSLTGSYFLAENAGLFASKTQKISRAALEPLENVLFFSNSSKAFTELQSGMAAYESGHYEEAAHLLLAHVNQRPDNAARVYLGVAQLMTGQASKPIPPLAIASQSQEPPVREAALWYLALAYLENDNAFAAIEALETIPPNSVYGIQTKALLQKLK